MAEGALFYLVILVIQVMMETWRSIQDELDELPETVFKLQEIDSKIHAILDAEAKSKPWLKRREDAMCDADDLDEIFLEDLIGDVMTLDKLCIDLNRYFFFLFLLLFFFL